MLRRIILIVLGLIAVLIVFLGIGLVTAHVAIRRERAPLPSAAAIEAAAAGEDRPLRLLWINTASQVMPRGGVLSPEQDPSPNDPYVMSHPSFVLEWADGRLLLIDTGMNREQALNFGWPVETLSGGAPIQPLLSVAERLGAQSKRVQGVVLTHLHTDHTGGIIDLCKVIGGDLRVFMTDAQRERPNHTTKPGLELLKRAGCAKQEPLPNGALKQVPGFPGVFVIAAGGHTPGSQIIIANVASGAATKTYAFVGDIVNNIDGIVHDVPKPLLYRLLIVPEDDERQSELRHYLRDLQENHGVSLVVAHDQREIEGLNLPSWEP